MRKAVFTFALLILVLSQSVVAQTEKLLENPSEKSNVQIGFPIKIVSAKAPPVAKVKPESVVKVEIKTDEQGFIISAAAIDGHPLLRAVAVVAARNSKFTPTTIDGKEAAAQGFINYYFRSLEANNFSFALCAAQEKCDSNDFENRKSARFFVINSDRILNDKAVYLETPKISDEIKAQARKDKIVTVRVIVESDSGKVVAADVVSGIELLRKPAVDAALKTTFSPANINSGFRIYVSGLIVYRIPARNKK